MYGRLIVPLGLFQVTDEPVKLWDVKHEVHEEIYCEVVESRGINLGYEFLQVLVSAVELQRRESGEDRAGEGGRTSALWVWARSRGLESQPKPFEPGQGGQASDHHVR